MENQNNNLQDQLELLDLKERELNMDFIWYGTYDQQVPTFH